jgi:hypothetical protein
MMSKAEKPSKNSNAADHHMVGSSNKRCSVIGWFFATRDLLICGPWYDTMMMVVGESGREQRRSGSGSTGIEG